MKAIIDAQIAIVWTIFSEGSFVNNASYPKRLQNSATD